MSATRLRKPITLAPSALKQRGYGNAPPHRKFWQHVVNGDLGDCVVREANGRWSYYDDRQDEIAARLGLTAQPGAAKAA